MRARHRQTQPNRRKSPADREAKAAAARSGRLIVGPPSCAASDLPRDSPRVPRQNRRTSAQIQIIKKQTATQAIERPALRWKGRTVETGRPHIQAI